MADVTLSMERGSVLVGDGYEMNLFVLGEPSAGISLAANIQGSVAIAAALTTAINFAVQINGTSEVQAQLGGSFSVIEGSIDVDFQQTAAYQVAYVDTRSYNVQVSDGTVYSVGVVTTKEYSVGYDA